MSTELPNPDIGVRRSGYTRVDHGDGRQSEAVQRFRHHKEQMRDWYPGEVTNERALSVILDVYALHLEREGRVVVSE